MEVDDIPCVFMVFCALIPRSEAAYGARPQATIGLICVSELIPADNRQQVTPQESFGHGLPIAYASAPAASYPSPTAPFSPAPSAIPHPEWPLAAGRSQAYISQPEMSTGSEVYGIPPAFVNPVQMEHMPYWGGLPGTDAIPPMVLHSAPVFDPYATSGAAPLASEPDNTKGALFGTMVAQVQAIPYNGKNSLVFVFGVGVLVMTRHSPALTGTPVNCRTSPFGKKVYSACVTSSSTSSRILLEGAKHPSWLSV